MFANKDRSAAGGFVRGLDLSGAWFNVDHNGVLSYTPLGKSVYKPLFARVGVDILTVRSPEEHRAAVRRAIEVEHSS